MPATAEHTYPCYVRIYMNREDAANHLYAHACNWATKYSAWPEKAEEYAQWYVAENLEAERWIEHPIAARAWECRA